MIKKIGNFLKLIFFSFLLTLNADEQFNVSLIATDINGNELKSAGFGTPFLIKLHISGNADNKSYPTIVNLDKYSPLSKQTKSKIFQSNGKVSIIKEFNYEIRIDNNGFYKIGPVQIDGKTYNSFLTINVQDEQKTITQKKINDNAFLKAFTKSKSIYAGQELELYVRFYFKGNISLQNIIIPKTNNFTYTTQSISDGTEDIDGEEYIYKEVKYLINPKTQDTLIIPAIKAAYVEQTQSFFFSLPQMKEVLSNALQISTNKLPPHMEPVNGVGNFKNFAAKLNQDTGIVGEGIVLKLEIESNNDLNNLKFENLILDKSIKHYASKNYIEKNKDGSQKKIFEFILQCNENKDYKIPEQKFVFFDPNEKIYKTLKTKSLMLKINPLEEKNLNRQELILDEIKPIYLNSKTINPQYFINNKIFIMLLILPILIRFLIYFSSLINQTRSYRNFKLNHNIAMQIKMAKKRQEISKLYKIFITFFCKKFNINESLITQEFIKEKLIELRMSENLLKQWNSFFEQVTQAAYYKKDLDSNQKLFVDAKQWLDIFKNHYEL